MRIKRSGLWQVVLGFGALLTLQSHADTQDKPEGEPVTIGQRYKIESKILNETRTYIVHKPGGYDFTNEAYPVIILLDGDANIQNVSASVDFLANNGRSMPMIVVGIENTDRQRDMTPPITSSAPEDRPDGNVGGARNFLDFIADELLPHIDRTYRTRPTRILIGHSYGGLFTVYALLNRPELFKAYIAVSPSLWWDNQALATQAEKFAANYQGPQTAVYMTMGSEGGPMLGGAQKVIGALASASETVSAEFQHWPEESHGSVVMRSVYEGIEALHEFYFTNDPIRTYEESGLQFFDKRFELISKYLGYEVKIPEHALMEIQYILTQMQRHAEAQKVLQRVLQLYPYSANAHFDLGKSYLETFDKQLAEAELKRTLEMYPGNTGARAALESLGVDPKTLVVDAAPAARILRGYVGEYRYSEETARVTLEDDKLFVTVRTDKRELRAQSDVNFYAVDLDREYTFNKKSGKVTSMTVRMPNFQFDSVKVK